MTSVILPIVISQRVINAEMSSVEEVIFPNIGTLTKEFLSLGDCWMSLDTRNAFNEEGDVATELKKSHVEAKNLLKKYFEGAVPNVETLVSSLRDYFKIFKFITYEEWSSNIEHTITMATQLQKKCKQVSQQHIQYSSKFKGEKIKVSNAVEVIKKWSTYRENQAITYDNTAYERKIDFFYYLFSIFESLEQKRQRYNMIYETEALAERERSIAKINSENIAVVEGTMLPGIEAIVTVIDDIGGFFNDMQHELTSHTTDVDKSRFYFQILKGAANEKYDECSTFHHKVSGVTSTVLAISGGMGEQTE